MYSTSIFAVGSNFFKVLEISSFVLSVTTCPITLWSFPTPINTVPPFEQDHQGIKSRYGPMKGIKNPFCALIFCTVFEEIRHFIRQSVGMLTRSARRRMMPFKINNLQNMMIHG